MQRAKFQLCSATPLTFCKYFRESLDFLWQATLDSESAQVIPPAPTHGHLTVCANSKFEEKRQPMKKMLMTMAISLAFACFGFAQAGSPSTTSPSQSDQSSAASSSQSGEKTLHGCIQSENGGYALQEKSGKTAMLSGSEDFSKHVGHEVRVHGTWSASSGSSASPTSPSSASSSASSPSASATAEGKTFNVDKLEMVSEQCSIK